MAELAIKKVEAEPGLVLRLAGGGYAPGHLLKKLKVKILS